MIQEKRLNHEDHLSRQGTKSWRQSEDATSVSSEAGFADEVRYEYPPIANMRSGSTFSSTHSPVVQVHSPVVLSDVRALRVLIRYNDGMKTDPQAGAYRQHASKNESVGIVC
jgi:hypothetical protein